MAGAKAVIRIIIEELVELIIWSCLLGLLLCHVCICLVLSIVMAGVNV